MNIDICRQLDEQDNLAGFRDQFHLPESTVYLDGNSLGPLLRSVAERINSTVSTEWGQALITSWNDHDWINLPITVGEKIATLIGAAPGQVICADSTSVNLFKVLASALALQPGRDTILSTNDNFPTDLYIAEGLSSLTGGRSRLALVEPADLLESLSTSVAALMLTEVNFRTGERWNMKAVNDAAHEAGVLVIWDLSHSTGAFPVALDDCQTDFAIGCGYKYLNGGPGAPSFVYVAERHQGVKQPLSGWMGHAEPFRFSKSYEPVQGIRRFSSGTPGIIGLAALDTALNIWSDINLAQVQSKSVSLARVITGYLDTNPVFSDVCLAGPGPGPEGGSQISLRHDKSYEIVQALIERRVIGDFRAPDIIRLGLCPLFLSHVDVFNAMNHLAEVLESGCYKEPRFSQRAFVT